MKSILQITLAMLILLHSLFAQAMVFSAPQVPEPEFQRYLLQKNQISYAQWVREQMSQSDLAPHEAVLLFAEQTLQEIHPSVSATWEQVETDLELHAQDREAFQSLAEKVYAQNSTDAKSQLAVCRYLILDRKLSDSESAAPQVQDCRSILQKWRLGFTLEEDDLLLIDGVPFGKNDVPKALIPGKYHWRLISNRYQDQEWVGSLAEASAQQRQEKPWVHGSCDQSQLDHPDFSVLSQAQVYFSTECLRPGLQQEKAWGQWATDHKVLLWGLGILAVGAAAYQLRDKTLVFTQP